MSRLFQRFRRFRRMVATLGTLSLLLIVALFWKLSLNSGLQQELDDTRDELAETRESANLGNRNREQAEDLAAYLLNDLRSELVPLGRTDILGQSAERTLAYFENLPPALQTPGTLASRASILSTLANVRHANGDFEEATRLWNEVITLRRQQLAEAPRNGEIPFQLVSDHNERAIPLRKARKFKEAISANKEALSILQELEQSAEAGQTEDLKIARAMTLFSLGENERAAGNQQGAIRYYRDSIQCFENEIPNDTKALQAVMTCYNNTGWCLMDLNDDQCAEESYLKALEPARRLVIEEPENRHWQKEIATLLNNLGTIYDERGENEKAAAHFEEALAMRSSLISWDPANTRWQSNYANSLRNLGSLKLQQGNAEDAYGLVQESLRVFQNLLTREPGNEDWLRTLQRETRHFQNRFQQAGQPEIAAALNEEVRTFVESLANTSPVNSASWNQFLSKLYNDLSLTENTDSEEAIAARLKSATLRARNLEDAPESVDTRYQLAAGYLDLALNCLREERPREALSCLQLARFLFTEKCPPLLYDREVLIDFIVRREEALQEVQAHRLLPASSLWSYYDDRNPPPPNWKDLEFEDSEWQQGKGQLGYGDGDEATLLDYGPDSERKNLTAWFRHEFTLTSPLAGSFPLRLSLLCDDGAVLYLNGQEVLRHNMPTGEISPTTVATRTQAGRDEDIYRVFLFEPDQLPLQKGRNVWAAEVHQNEPESSDLSFDLEILANAPVPPPLQDFDLELAREFLQEALPATVLSWIEEQRQVDQP